MNIIDNLTQLHEWKYILSNKQKLEAYTNTHNTSLYGRRTYATISCAFSWAKSPQGFIYWSKLENKRGY